MSNLNINDCVLVNEASSTQTAFFSYNSEYQINKIWDKDKLSLRDHRIDEYALKKDAEGYFTAIFNNSNIQDHIINSNCDKFYWSLLATGGMRDFEDQHGSELVDNFYFNLKGHFAKYPEVCSEKACKEITLVDIKTITGSDEAYYAWTALKSYEGSDCHAIFDIGGQTGQFSNSSHSYSAYLGKERAMQSLGSNADPCYSHQNKYDGAQCRSNILQHFESSFTEMLTVEHSQHCKIFAISNFYNYFNDIYGSYLPHIKNNNLNINEQILEHITELCTQKASTDSLNVALHGYKYITDAVCMHWSDSWEGNQAKYANSACYSGNHNYQALKLLGIEDEHEIHVHSADWAPGAAMNIFETCLAD